MSDNTSKNAITRSGFKRGIKKGFLLLFVLIVIISGISVYGKYFYTISDGSRTGQLLKFSHNDNLAKTFEGEMLLSKDVVNKDDGKESGRFYFSVSKNTLAQQLDTVQGQTITVHFNKKNKAFRWYSNTEYLVDKVKRMP